MRLLPPAWALSRDATAPVEIGEYRWPAGTCFYLNLWSIHRDARFYRDPERFFPERWTADFQRLLPRFAYFPFGGGQRMCIGAGFAKMEAALILAAIVQRFRLSPAPGWHLRLDPGVVLRPKGGVPMRLERRSRSRASVELMQAPVPAPIPTPAGNARTGLPPLPRADEKCRADPG